MREEILALPYRTGPSRAVPLPAPPLPARSPPTGAHQAPPDLAAPNPTLPDPTEPDPILAHHAARSLYSNGPAIRSNRAAEAAPRATPNPTSPYLTQPPLCTPRLARHSLARTVCRFDWFSSRPPMFSNPGAPRA